MTSSPKEVSDRLARIVEDGFVCMSVAAGAKLGLFDALFEHSSETSRLTPAELAEKTNLKERYVREWLGSVACAKLVEVDEDGLRYWVPEANRNAYDFIPMSECLPVYWSVVNDISDCFKPDGPRGLPYSRYTEFYAVMDKVSSVLVKDTVDAIFARVPDMKRRLEDGATRCLDLGCGKGALPLHLAQRFPQSRFWGADFSEPAIAAARQVALPLSLSNLHYELLDAARMPADWSGKFDFVTAVDSIHDQARPDSAMREVLRMLKSGGQFAMVDIHGHGNVREDRDKKGLYAAFLYACSVFHCMPVSLYFDGGMGLGTMWGGPLAKKMLQAAGFVDVQEQLIPGPIENVLYLARKP